MGGFVGIIGVVLRMTCSIQHTTRRLTPFVEGHFTTLGQFNCTRARRQTRISRLYWYYVNINPFQSAPPIRRPRPVDSRRSVIRRDNHDKTESKTSIPGLSWS